jgi:DNA repair exonuclease SbcCD ATPase subunit
MYIKFISVEIEGFQSIGKANIELCNRGTTIIKGINNYDDKAESNGSGKSSCMESIFWAIYGKTSSGIADPTNRNTSNGCMVNLNFMIDSVDYTILRSINHNVYKTSLLLKQGSQDLTGRNKTDTDKIIHNDVFPISQDLFLSTIFLSQGFSGRISSLSPSGRKDRLENLTQTSEKLEVFKSQIGAVNDDLNSKDISIRSEISYSHGRKDNIESEISRLENSISEEAKKGILNDSEIKSINDKVSSLRLAIDKLVSAINESNIKLSDNKRSMKDIYLDKNKMTDEQRDINNKMKSVSDNKCPTCHQPIGSSISKELRNEYQKRLDVIDSEISKYDIDYASLSDECNKLQNSINSLDDKKSMISTRISELADKISNCSDYRAIENYKNRLIEAKAELVDITKDISTKDTEKSSIEEDLAVSNHCLSLISKQFRNYLLKNTVDFMNGRLTEYSRMLFSNDKDTVYVNNEDSSKLDIYLGNSIYDTLSGGEQRKVDLALVLAQRDVAMNISGSSSNILVLDEVFDNLDSTAIEAVSSMFFSVSSEIDSMFIISHKDVGVSYDSVITVEKGKDEISRVIDEN